MRGCQWIDQMKSCHDNYELDSLVPWHEDTPTRHATNEIDPTSQEPMLKTPLPEDTRRLHASDNEGSKQHEEWQQQFMEERRKEALWKISCKTIPEPKCKKTENCVWSPSKNECLNKAIETARQEAIKHDERLEKIKTRKPNAQTPAQPKEEFDRRLKEIESEYEKRMERSDYENRMERLAKDVKGTTPQATQEEKKIHKKEEDATKKEALWKRYQKEHPKPTAMEQRLFPGKEQTWKEDSEKYSAQYLHRTLKDIDDFKKPL